MNQEEEIKGAIVVFADEILFASPELNHAGEAIAFHSAELVNFVKTIDPELNRVEAMYVAVAIIKSLPAQFAEDPEMLAGLKELTKEFRDLRR